MTGIAFIFLCLLAAILTACAIGFAVMEARHKKRVTKVLQTVSGDGTAAQRPVVLLQQPHERGLIAQVLSQLNLAAKLQSLVSQAGLEWSVNQLVTASLVLGGAGFLLGYQLNLMSVRMLSMLLTGGVLASLPYLFAVFKRKSRFAEIEQQLPETLDFLARSMRAGHAFSVSLEMLGQETPDPLGREFRTLYNEQNLGASIETALNNLATRVPLLDVRFFVAAILLQRQTGGNLSEILTRLGYVIRERFQLKGQVKAASAHGKMTANILSFMPVALSVGLLLIAPGYLAGMVKDPDGRNLIYAAIGAQLLGYYVIKRIVDIKI